MARAEGAPPCDRRAPPSRSRLVHPTPAPAPAHVADVPVRGIVLRSALVLQLRAAGRPLTVRDLVDGLARQGVTTVGRASKDVSDALRWEVRRGRVRRVGRATYELGHVPRQTAARMRHRLRAATDCRSEA